MLGSSVYGKSVSPDYVQGYYRHAGAGIRKGIELEVGVFVVSGYINA